eukprot:6431602-Amphidinium_carterae.1
MTPSQPCQLAQYGTSTRLANLGTRKAMLGACDWKRNTSAERCKDYFKLASSAIETQTCSSLAKGCKRMLAN